MREVVIFLFICIFFISCNEDIIYYEYEDVTITRINKDNRTYFYYGKCDNSKLPCRKSYIRVEWKGFNSGISAYLKINKTEDSQISNSMGYFEEINNDDNLRIKILHKKHSSDHINEPEIAKLYGKHYVFSWVDSIAHGFYYDNVIYLSDIISHEKEKNLKLKTKVKAIYPKDIK